MLPHAVPAGSFVYTAIPALQSSCVHWLLSLGLSASFAIHAMPPMALQTAVLQSPGVCAMRTVMSGAIYAPQTWFVQIGCVHSLFTPEHSPSRLHATQVPMPS